VQTATARPGLIVVDASLTVVGSNAEAVRILTFPETTENGQRRDALLTAKVRSMFVEKRPPRLPNEFHSAKRTYSCRSFPLEMFEHRNGSGWLLVMLERAHNEAVTIALLAAHFGLTTREEETVKLLLEGLTSKEIAQRMKISPNTVKAFIRLVMVKLNVSTRSGIIGKIVAWKGGTMPANGNDISHRFNSRLDDRANAIGAA
jgi:DNA-binding CsgD family transcriptional regulator